MGTKGAREEKRVIGFEIHCPVGSSSSMEFVFEARGVFGVETWLGVLDRNGRLRGSDTQQGELVDAMNLEPKSIGKLENVVGRKIEWRVKNLMGTEFKAFVMMRQWVLVGFAFDMNGWYRKGEEEE